MKKIILFTVFCLVFSLGSLSAQNASVEISFAFTKQSGFSSNQYAVWVEDSRGNLIKTLFAAKFTAEGGWKKRPESIPLWVSKSGLSSLSKKDIDAFSGATPKTGTMNYRWDGTDKNGNRMPQGEYKIFLEATLRGENRVLYSAALNLGSPIEAEMKPEYFGSGTKERGMIGDIKLLYRP